MINSVEILGFAITAISLLLLLHFGKQQKHIKTYPLTVSFWCNWSGEQYVTPVRNLYHAQGYINKINLAGVVQACVYEGGVVTYRLGANGIWEAVS